MRHFDGMKVKQLIAAASILFSTPAWAGDQVYANDGTVHVYRETGECTLITMRSDLAMFFHIAYDESRDHLVFTLGDKRFKSIVLGKKYELKAAIGSEYDQHLYEVTAVGLTLSDSNALRFSTKKGAEVLGYLQKAEMFGLARGDISGEVTQDQIIYTFSPNIIRKMIPSLISCAKTEAVVHPHDPLEGM
ncbi:hypothetical protein SAMN05518849_11659 [Sphingobium sp. AP50]|uniref:hypothetical protein n=1 Tax=Sphingobium sp. AP50 TaxID=1884369 RepID=UPI0008BB7B07|nr:hypothetical protein [Sphingobium sp. AP50]SEJ87162.1 hypothetical protein SAMN05518849_11659 [Sphingobium sp. AP50]